MYSSGVTLLLSLWKKIKLLTSKYWSSFCSDITFKKMKYSFLSLKAHKFLLLELLLFKNDSIFKQKQLRGTVTSSNF